MANLSVNGDPCKLCLRVPSALRAPATGWGPRVAARRRAPKEALLGCRLSMQQPVDVARSFHPRHCP